MKRNKKQKTLTASLLIMSCIGMLLSGCGADDKETEIPNAGQEITEADIKTAGSSPQEDIPLEPAAGTSETKEPEETEPQAVLEDTSAGESDLYEQFLHNAAAATLDKNFTEDDYRLPVLEAETPYTLSELGASVSKYYLDPEYTDKTSYDYVQYAYVNCLDSTDTAQKNLLIKFTGLNIYTPDDDSYAVFVITEKDGRLFITQTYECWARGATTAYANGLLQSYGSGGAGDHYDGLSALLSDGSNPSIYSCEILSGWWTSYVNESIYNEIFDENTETNLSVSIYTIGGDTCYLYDTSYCSEEELPLCENYIDRCQTEAGINWVTGEDIDAAIQNQCAALGIDYNATQSQEEAVWNDL